MATFVTRTMHLLLFNVGNSVTRLGKISQTWQVFRFYGNFDGLCIIWQSLNQLWQIVYAIGQIFIAVNGQVLSKCVAIWSQCS